MSADNWTICPRCKKNREAEVAATNAEVANSYGAVPVGKYLEMLRDAEKLAKLPLLPSLWENWELGTEYDGKFYVIYHCGCDKCSFAHSFRHEERLSVSG